MSSLDGIFSPARGLATGGSDRRCIREHLLTSSRYIQTPNFARCHDSDLRILFDQYDDRFFDRQLSDVLRHHASFPLPLKFTGRLRSSGGRTTRTRDRRAGTYRFAIDISHNVLFQNFRTPEETATVVGLKCLDRVDAMMRVMEHELIHLAEFLAFGESSCARHRFQHAAHALFGHTAHQHAMVTRRQKTIQNTPFRPGHRVRFTHDGQPLTGTVNRINTRATVLVENPKGTRYTDGKRYLKFYVPVTGLLPL